jgi:histidinol phosphatase-like PHP family hydrolase
MIESLQNDIAKINSPVQILIGVEADVVAKDKLSIDKSFANELDYVIVSASHFHLPGIEKPESTNMLDIAQHYVNKLKIALSFDFVSIIAHPFKTPYNPLGSPLDYLNKIPVDQLYEIAAISKQKKIAMEINAILGTDQEYLTAISKFIAVCKEVGVKFTYGSDAHNKTALMPSRGIEKAINALNLKPSDFLCTDELIHNHRSAFA